MLDAAIIADSPSAKNYSITLYPIKDTPREILWAMRINHQGVAVTDYTPEMITGFIPSGACPFTWLRNVRNAASPSKPKARKRHYEPKRDKSRTAAQGFGRVRAGASL